MKSNKNATRDKLIADMERISVLVKEEGREEQSGIELLKLAAFIFDLYVNTKSCPEDIRISWKCLRRRVIA